MKLRGARRGQLLERAHRRSPSVARIAATSSVRSIADRAPRDAAPAADAARAPELVEPGRQLVRHPLPVARPARRAHAAAMDVRVVDREARVPALDAHDLLAGQVGHVLDRRAEAGRADHRAVPACQAARRDVIPARVLEVALEEVADVGRVHLAAHLCDRVRVRRVRRLELGACGRRARHVAQDVLAALTPGLRDEVVLRAVEHLGERDVEARLRPRTGAHRAAEARRRCLPALHGDDECVLAALQHAVEDAHRMQVARPRPDERVAHRRARLGEVRQLAVGAAARAPQRLIRGQLEALPRVRADVVAEQGVVVASHQPVVPALLLVRPSRRQIGAGAQLVVDDRPLTHARSDDRVATLCQRREQPVEVTALDHVHGAIVTRALAARRTSARCPPPASRDLARQHGPR